MHETTPDESPAHGDQTDDEQTPDLTDPGSKTQPAEGGRDEADDDGAAGGETDVANAGI